MSIKWTKEIYLQIIKGKNMIKRKTAVIAILIILICLVIGGMVYNRRTCPFRDRDGYEIMINTVELGMEDVTDKVDKEVMLEILKQMECKRQIFPYERDWALDENTLEINCIDSNGPVHIVFVKAKQFWYVGRNAHGTRISNIVDADEVYKKLVKTINE